VKPVVQTTLQVLLLATNCPAQTIVPLPTEADAAAHGFAAYHRQQQVHTYISVVSAQPDQQQEAKV
jgi:hypothetical protein